MEQVLPAVLDNIQVDPRIEATLRAEWLVTLAIPHMSDYPLVFSYDTGELVDVLHCFVWARLKGEPPARLVLHHRDHDKHNARIANLELLPREGHAARHRAEQQRFSPRKREDFAGLYRPHAPGPLKVLSFREVAQLLRRRKLLPPSATRRLKAEGQLRHERMKADEAALVMQSERLRSETAHLDSGARIPPADTRRTGRDLRLGLGKKAERRGCTRAERTFVWAYAKHLEAGAEDVYAAAALDLGVSAALLRALAERPAVDLALGRWRTYRRLPRASEG